MNYRSIGDLAKSIRTNIHKLPRDIDLVVGIARSGMLAADIIGLNLNIRQISFEGYLEDTPLPPRNTRQPQFQNLLRPSDARHVLIVDDSIRTGESLLEIKRRMTGLKRDQRVTFCAIYAAPIATSLVDVYFDIVSDPRSFEWNMLHRPMLLECCLDIDGVICVDPTDAQNDDGAAYAAFLQNAVPLVVPTYKVGHLVTSRLEKYRGLTEEWLERYGVEYEVLHMLDLPDAATRRRLACHAEFKAKVFRALKETVLFIESEPRQASQIANRSGKPALCFTTQELFEPNFSYALVDRKVNSFLKRLARKFKQV